MILSLLLLTAPLTPGETPDPPPVGASWANVSYDSRLVADPPPVQAASPVVPLPGGWVQGPDGLYRFVPNVPRPAPAVNYNVAPIRNVAPGVATVSPFAYNTARTGTTTPTTTVIGAGRVSTSYPGAARVAHTLTPVGGAARRGITNCGAGG